MPRTMIQPGRLVGFSCIAACLVGCSGNNPRIGFGAGVRTVTAQYMGERIPDRALPTVELTYTEEVKKNLDLHARLSFVDVPESWGDKMYKDGTGEGSFVAVSVGPRWYFADAKRSRFGVGLGFEVYAGEYDVEGMAAAIYHVDLDERLWGVGLSPQLVWEHELGKSGDTKFVVTLGYDLTETVTDDPAHVDLDGPTALFELQKPLRK